jgi:hypothetical protein
MGRPLRAKYANTTYVDGVQEMSNTDISSLIVPLISQEYVDRSGSAASFPYGQVLVLTGSTSPSWSSPYVIAGSVINTHINNNLVVGDHPATNTTTRWYLIQNINATSTSVTNLTDTSRPVQTSSSDGVRRIQTMTNVEIQNDVISNVVSTIINGGQGAYWLGTTAPSDGGTWVVRSTITDSYSNTSGVVTTTYNLYQKTSSGSVGTVRPLKRLANNQLQEMTNAEIIALTPYIRDYIATTGIGTYYISTSTPPGGGTWVARGSFVDTRNILTDDSYSGSYLGTFSAGFTGGYTRAFTGNYQGSYVGSFVGDYAGNYDRTFTRFFTGTYIDGFLGLYSGTYTGNFTGLYSGNYAGGSLFTGAAGTFQNFGFTGLYVGSFSRFFSGTFTGNYTRAFAGTYTGTYAGSYSGVYGSSYLGGYAGTRTAGFTRGFSGTYTSSTYTREFSGAFVGAYQNPFNTEFYSGAYTSPFISMYLSSGAVQPTWTSAYTGAYLGAYLNPFNNVTYEGFYAGIYRSSFILNQFVGTYDNTFSRDFTGVWTGSFTGSRIRSFTGTRQNSFVGSYNQTFIGTYNRAIEFFNTTVAKSYTRFFTGTYSGSYQQNFTGGYLGLYNRANDRTRDQGFTRFFTGIYQGTYQQTFIGFYAGTYNQTFSGSYGNAFSRLFTGAYSGLTVSASTTSTTYTLWVRTA